MVIIFQSDLLLNSVLLEGHAVPLVEPLIIFGDASRREMHAETTFVILHEKGCLLLIQGATRSLDQNLHRTFLNVYQVERL